MVHGIPVDPPQTYELGTLSKPRNNSDGVPGPSAGNLIWALVGEAASATEELDHMITVPVELGDLSESDQEAVQVAVAGDLPHADALPTCGLGDAQLKPVRLAHTELPRAAPPTPFIEGRFAVHDGADPVDDDAGAWFQHERPDASVLSAARDDLRSLLGNF